MSTQGLLSSVFSCSPTSKAVSKRRLRQTKSLDTALMRHYGTESKETSENLFYLRAPEVSQTPTGDYAGDFKAPDSHLPSILSPQIRCQSASSNLVNTCASLYFDCGSKTSKRNAAWDLQFLTRNPLTATGSSNTLVSPRKWLQKKSSPSINKSYVVWKFEGDFTWNSMSGRSVGLKPVPLQSLSELERVRLQDVSFCRLLQDHDLGCHVTIPKDGQKRKKSLRRKLDSLAKEKSKDKDSTPQAFGLLLSQVIANDRAHKQRQDPRRRREAAEELRDPGEPFPPFVQPSSHGKRGTKELSSSNSSLSSTSETPGECPVPSVPEAGPYTRRRGGVSVDCITDLDDNQSRLLEALQLSLPSEASGNPKKQRDKKLSLNPIYRQVPRVVNCCCQHLEKYGLQTVGVFRVGSSKKRVRQLREEYDQGLQVTLDEENSVHDVAALLKEFLRDMPDPLLTRELYTAFINTLLLDHADQDSALQLLIYLLPPCNSDTLQCLLHFLATVAAHADNRQDGEGQEITGNKMTPLNLATIFGPNLLHKQKISDKEFAVQSFARAEESTAIIGVVQRMITTQETLFMVPPDLQNEVLVSLLETDPDVVDYLLRRKASQYSDPVLLRTESFSLSERGSSSDSNKASSGEVSPYDNNSPVLSERLVWQFQGDGNLLKLPGQYSKGRPGDTCPSPTNDKEGHRENVGSWGAWHAKLKREFIEQHTIGRLGDVHESDPHDLSEGLDSHRGNSKPPVRRTQTSLGLPECRPHPPLTRCSSSPQEPWEMRQPVISLLPPPPCGQSGAYSFEDFLARGTPPVSPSMRGKPGSDSRTVSRPPPPYPGPLRATPVSHSNPVLSTEKQAGGGTILASRQGHKGRSLSPQRGSSGPASRSVEGRWPGSTERPREKWQIWQLLSPDNGDTLPETLV